MQGKLEALLSMAQEKGHFLVWKPPGCETGVNRFEQH
jgi:hypothetical protein